MTQPHAWASILIFYAPLPEQMPTVYPWQLVQEVRIRDLYWGWKWPVTHQTKDRVLPSHGERRMIKRHGYMVDIVRRQDRTQRVYTHVYRLVPA
jgi:hypothetical protein